MPTPDPRLRDAQQALDEADAALEETRSSLACPACQSQQTYVIDVRALAGGLILRRRRECHTCDHRFSSYEMPGITRAA